MRQQTRPSKEPAEKVVQDIRRATWGIGRTGAAPPRVSLRSSRTQSKRAMRKPVNRSTAIPGG